MKTFLLGDGQLCLRSIPRVRTLDQLILGYEREPLVGFFIILLSNFFILLKTSSPAESAYCWLSILSGIIFTIVAWRLVRSFSEDRTEQFLFFLLLITSGASQLFFGYIENYPPTYAAILVFLFLSIRYFEGKILVAWAIGMYGILLLFHLGTLAFFPAFIFLAFVSLKRKQAPEFFASLFLTGAVFVTLLKVSGFTSNFLQSVLEHTGHHIVPVSLPIDTNQAYTFFTWKHLIDILNFLLLCYPAGIILFIVTAFNFWQKPKSLGLGTWFLLLTALCGFAFIVLLNCDLGMSRDWDILAPIGSGITVAAASAWATVVEKEKQRRTMLALLVVVSFLHFAPWIGVNADEQRAIARFQVIQDEELWSVRARLDAYEELAIFYRDRGELDKAIQCYTRYMVLLIQQTSVYGGNLLKRV